MFYRQSCNATTIESAVLSVFDTVKTSLFLDSFIMVVDFKSCGKM